MEITTSIKLFIIAGLALAYLLLIEVYSHVIARRHAHLSTAGQTLYPNHPKR